ncbi:efflux RND transporter permease subunit, partial [Klebsiella pneumoniae]|uniref:efflux RND transporter permease subunit n=1 Tax=Klebsiella pneumoniae TaxID=573 RepID=UPI0020347825
VLDDTARRGAAVLQGIQGAQEVKVEQTPGLPMMTVNIDRDKAARYGLNMSDVQEAVATGIGGREAGTFFQGDRRFDIVVRLPETVRADV